MASRSEAIYHLGVFVRDSSYAGTFVFGFVKRMLIPFGLHHVFIFPFWQTGLGGSMVVDGQVIQGLSISSLRSLASPHVTPFQCRSH